MTPAPAARILVVEDDGTLRTIFVRWLAQRGHSVHACATGREAREAVAGRAGAFRLAIVDLTLPDADGVALVEELRSADPGLRVIATSGLPRAVEGAAGFLAKPFTSLQLGEEVSKLLR